LVGDGVLKFPTASIDGKYLKELVKCKKRKGDKPTSKMSVQEHREFWDEIKCRSEQTENDFIRDNKLDIYFKEETKEELTTDVINMIMGV